MKNDIMYKAKEKIMARRRPTVSAMRPEGISSMFTVTARMAMSVPISRKEIPDSRKKRIMKGSKKRKFFKKPYAENFQY